MFKRLWSLFKWRKKYREISANFEKSSKVLASLNDLPE